MRTRALVFESAAVGVAGEAEAGAVTLPTVALSSNNSLPSLAWFWLR